MEAESQGSLQKEIVCESCLLPPFSGRLHASGPPDDPQP
jgi:hypothetical protein